MSFYSMGSLVLLSGKIQLSQTLLDFSCVEYQAQSETRMHSRKIRIALFSGRHWLRLGVYTPSHTHPPFTTPPS